MASRTATTVVPLQNGSLTGGRAASAPASKTQSPPVARPYKDFLTPALHRRFTKASAILLLLCWAEAALMSHAGWFWSWFPLSLTGLRALVLFIPCLAVFIIRVANFHVGQRAAASPFEGVLQTLVSVRAVLTVVWYCFSGWFFGEVYMWTRGQDAGLGWVDYGAVYERSRLNENPIYLRAMFMSLAVGQACLHLLRDADRVPIEAHAKQEKSKAPEDTCAKVPQALQDLAAQAGPLLNRAMLLICLGIAVSNGFYFLLFRKTLWRATYWFARIYFRDLPKKAQPTGLIDFGTIAWQTLTSCLMLVLLWEVSNAAFTILVAEPPLKKGQPLTSEIQDARGVIISKSRDPNGSLIRGLRAKNEAPKSFAFWELYLICTTFDARRKTIFTEVDRSKELGTTFSQIANLCLMELSAITARIQASQQPAASKKQAAELALQKQQQEDLMPAQKQEALGLPKIASPGTMENRAIFQKQSGSNDFAQTVGSMAKSLGQHPGATNPVLPRARRAAKWVADEAMSKETQSRFSNSGIGHEANSYMLQFLRSPVGWCFQHTFARRACAVVFGVPHSNRVNIVHAARSLARLSVCSLKEDDYGQVAKSIPAIVRAFTAAIGDIDGFMATLPPNWTDVNFVSRSDRRVPEVEAVQDVLRQGLEQILLAFAEYASAVGLTKKEVREAREAVGRGGREMVKI